VWLRVADVDAASDAPVVAYAVTRGTGTAVDRNRIRRRLRAAVAVHGAELGPGRAYLFGADRRVLHAPYASLVRAVGDLLRAHGEMTQP
jgi:ribonuclease P protein component